MTFLYVVTDRARVRKSGGSFLVFSEDDVKLLEIESRALEGVLLLETVQITTQALCEMLEMGIELAYLSRNGKLLGQLTPPMAKNIELRKSQYAKESDPEFALAMAKRVVAAKLRNSAQVVRTFTDDTPGDQPRMEECAKLLNEYSARALDCTSLPSLLGIEGSGAREYWGAYAGMVRCEGSPFTQRQQHPSPDPVNAALSFGYVMLTNSFSSLLDGIGFDPHLGFYHAEGYGRPSLALDLLEPYRPAVIDRMVMRLFNLKVLEAEDFEPDGEGGCRMSKEALRAYFTHWEKTMAKTGLRKEMRRLAEELRKVFLGECNSDGLFEWRPR